MYGAEAATPVAALLLFGDDLSGNNVAFDPTRDWRVVVIDPIAKKASVKARTFSSFVRKLLSKGTIPTAWPTLKR